MDGTQCDFCEVRAYRHVQYRFVLQRIHINNKLVRSVVLAKFASKSWKLRLARSTCTVRPLL